MATKVDILDFALVKNVEMTCSIDRDITIQLELLCESKEDFDLVYETILEKVNGMRNK